MRIGPIELILAFVDNFSDVLSNIVRRQRALRYATNINLETNQAHSTTYSDRIDAGLSRGLMQ